MHLSLWHRRNVYMTQPTRQQPMDANLGDTARLKLGTETYRNTYLHTKQSILFSFILVTVKKKLSKTVSCSKLKRKTSFRVARIFD